MDIDTALILTLVFFLAANLVQGFTGFGVGIVAVVGLSLIGEVIHATVLTNLGSVVSVSLVFGRLWRHASWRHLWPVLVGMATCIPVGLMFLRTFGPTHPELVRRVLGLVVVAFSVWSLWGRSPTSHKMRWYVGLAAGMLGGMLGGAFTIGGPPMVAYIYSLPVSRDAMKASINACFVLGSTFRLMLVIAAGDVTRPVLVEFAWCLPAIVLGVVVGMVLARGVSTEGFRRIAWYAFGVLGLLLAAR